jgi:predicted aminopeptidase
MPSEKSFAAQIAASKKACDLAQKRYESGCSGYNELLDTQRTLNAAQLLYLASRKNRLGASVDLFKAPGGGWQTAPDNTGQHRNLGGSCQAETAVPPAPTFLLLPLPAKQRSFDEAVQSITPST